jgi:histidinol-phosphate phosphatase family protein
MSLKDLHIDQSWTLFLDRDGVINKRIVDSYIKRWEEFEFLPGVTEALKKLNNVFGKILVVTNQQGIGKGLYTADDLDLIHGNMVYEVKQLGGRIDKVYFSPYLNSENHPTRKPATGMAALAQQDFPEVSFEKSIMVGDSMSDMQFGRSCGMKTVFISEKQVQDPRIDYNFISLLQFSKAL